MIRFKRKETITTTTIAPIIDGIMIIPATFGPQLPKTASPIDEPTNPAHSCTPISDGTNNYTNYSTNHQQCIKFTPPFLEISKRSNTSYIHLFDFPNFFIFQTFAVKLLLMFKYVSNSSFILCSPLYH